MENFPDHICQVTVFVGWEVCFGVDTPKQLVDGNVAELAERMQLCSLPLNLGSGGEILTFEGSKNC